MPATKATMRSAISCAAPGARTLREPRKPAGNAMWTRLALLLAVAVAAQAQDDPKELLLRVSQRVMEAVNRLPKYICTLTIDRAEYKSNGIVEAHSCDKLAAEK